MGTKIDEWAIDVLYWQRGEAPMNYKEAYYYLFNEVSDLIEKLKEIHAASEEICIAQSKLDAFEKAQTQRKE